MFYKLHKKINGNAMSSRGFITVVSAAQIMSDNLSKWNTLGCRQIQNCNFLVKIWGFTPSFCS